MRVDFDSERYGAPVLTRHGLGQGSCRREGVELYSREARGDVIRLPEQAGDLPDRDALEWHMDEVFLSA